eukprot:CAMPEP_0177664426 /NCGR_PEP_ID=MMETSP0447-20121125/20487_1 /TAXON_ID=0 /ORGANISM="Stygamoeba regulata, Strain BSH-02190019" /LENGTH=232 /DNA_ID=CAMNT_0019170397 /DNA_START=351 /DNA_END=1049 /DNA_ORIENTATION=+
MKILLVVGAVSGAACLTATIVGVVFVAIVGLIASVRAIAGLWTVHKVGKGLKALEGADGVVSCNVHADLVDFAKSWRKGEKRKYGFMLAGGTIAVTSAILATLILFGVGAAVGAVTFGVGLAVIAVVAITLIIVGGVMAYKFAKKKQKDLDINISNYVNHLTSQHGRQGAGGLPAGERQFLEGFLGALQLSAGAIDEATTNIDIILGGPASKKEKTEQLTALIGLMFHVLFD